MGSVAASAAGDPKVFGLDSAIGAGFIALIWPQLNTAFKQRVAIAGAVTALAVIPFVRPGLPILLAGCVALVIGLSKKLEN